MDVVNTPTPIREMVDHLMFSHGITAERLEAEHIYLWGRWVKFFDALDISIKDGDTLEFLQEYHTSIHEEEEV